MTRPVKIDRVRMNQMLQAGKSVTEIAKHFDVTLSAVSRAKKELNLSVIKNVGLERAHQVAAETLDTIVQLRKINEYANELLDEAMLWSGSDHGVKTDGDQVIKLMAEIRNQLKLQLEIFQTLYDMTAVAEFQKEVLTAIGEVSSDVRDRIIQKLKEKRAIRSTIDIH